MRKGDGHMLAPEVNCVATAGCRLDSSKCCNAMTAVYLAKQ
ncbi:hypothetical protein DLM_3031 [Aquitalea magnusonii]|uniref:Uncharacterized protein n=1 Tax=Aquitalea magnusonii TaxID=332411 RepID=A0A3G9GK73_9NEIS|nr:hypothetical protein DLM_3031 [Aquitalea magnusonii]